MVLSADYHFNSAKKENEMAFDSAVPVEGVEEKSTVVKPINKDTRQQADVKDNLGNLAKNPGIDRKTPADVEPGKLPETDKFSQP
jgi:hypothetical protein